jgi:signal transduction histidine kinase/ActR/RegA family two-component response regulator
MKKYIITSFAVIFLLFGLGSGVTIYHLLNTTTNLRQLISLHEIEDIRQELSFRLQKIQSYTFSSPAYFASNLDEVIDSANRVNQTVQKCYDCHHEPDVNAELNNAEELILEYQEQLSYLITMVSEGNRRREYQVKVLDLSNVILNQVQSMVSRAANTLNLKTSLAMRKIDESYIILGITLLFTFVAILLVAQYLAGRVTRPVYELLKATNKITHGELGYQADFQGGGGEFETLIATFNNMSASLAQQENKIQDTMNRLNQLNLVTLPLHSAHDMSIIINYLRTSINALIAAEHVGIMFSDEEEKEYTLHLFDAGANSVESNQITFERDEIFKVHEKLNGQSLMDNSMQEKSWPFVQIPADVEFKNMLLVWLPMKEYIKGALLVINKNEGDFSEEDLKIIGILANNMSVALENVRLFKDLQQQMLELKKTQRQLIEAEKLTALGTLAGGVAHDFNNILCGMIGYVALLKRNHDPEDKDFKMLDTIEKAGFRAANLTKQLLTFSRQEALDHRPIEVNPHIDNVAKLLENTISKLITIKLELADSLPMIQSDPAQLEQIIMNLSVNARDAMPSGGEILIASETSHIDQTFCDQHPEARPGDYIKLSVSDKGEGIDQEILPRIFEPFFTTKEFGKGTGLGLAMVYGIVKSHKGFIIVSSSMKKGTSFSVYLPITGFVKDDIIEPADTNHMLQANILIVDDEELVISMLTEHLQSIGCQTYHANNGEEALEIVEQNKDDLDVVILDLNMPVMGGRAAFEKIMELKPDLKVLVASGYALDNSVEEMLQRGAHGYIQKPYSLDNIAAKIRQAMTG